LVVKLHLYNLEKREIKMDRKEFQKAYGKVVAKAWSDEDFKAKLLADPKTVLKENGLEFPEDVELRVEETTDKIVHLFLPPEPTGQLSEEELEKVAGGDMMICFAGGNYNDHGDV
jgi:hypothetical protein